MNIVVDIGNTLQKIAVFSDAGAICRYVNCREIDDSLLDFLFSEFEISKSIYSSVGNNNQLVINRLSERTRFLMMSHQCRLPLKMLYATPETLGTDRIANAVGASVLFPNENVLSFMAGSCLVSDFVSASGEYLGGSISPGLMMRFRALEHFTSRLPLVEPQSEIILEGNDTEKSILSGVMNGLKYEIEGFIESYSRKYPNLKVVMSGGDAGLLQNFIKKRIFAAQNPILVGLNKILELNVSEN